MNQKIIYSIIFSIMAGCLIFLAFMDYLKLSGYAIGLVMILAPAYIYSQSKKAQNLISKEIIDIFQLVIAIAWFLNLLGSLDFYYFNKYAMWYDSLVHFINPLMIFSLTPLLLIIWQKIHWRKEHLWITIFGNIIVIIFFSFLWEYYEIIIDKIFPWSKMFGQNGETMSDTITDLIMDSVGGGCALLFYYFQLRRYLNKQLKV